MKRKILLIITLLIVPFAFAKADMGAPGILQYEAIVTNPDGTNLYNYEEKVVGSLNYNDKITISYEYDEKYAISDNEDGGYYIKKSDITPVKDKTSFTDKGVRKCSEVNDAYVLKKDGVSLHSGAAGAYKVIDTIPYGTKIKLEYCTEDTENDSPWYGIKYNGKEGWVEVFRGSIGYKSNFNIYLYEDSEIIDSVDSENANTLGKVKKGTVIEANHIYFLDPWSGRSYSYMEDFDGKSGYISYSSLYFIINNKGKVITYEDDEEMITELPVYKTVEDYFTDEEDKSKIIGNIPVGEEVFVKYYSEDLNSFYIEYKDLKGWVQPLYIDVDMQSNIVEEPIDLEPGTTSNKITFSPLEFSLICICSAMGVALIALVILLIVNKKH